VWGQGVLLLLGTALAGNAPAVSSELATTGSLRARLPVSDAANLVLLYGGEQDGELGTCGCARRPRGSLARVEGYRRALVRAAPSVPHLLLNAGSWLDTAAGDSGGLREDVRDSNEWMMTALEAGHWDALNLSYRDSPQFGLSEVPAAVLSANVRLPAGPPPWRLFDMGAFKVAVTGVSRAGLTGLQPLGTTIRDPVGTLQQILPQIQEQADVVVVLAYELGRDTGRVARLPGVDVLIEAGGYHERYDPFVEGEAVWVRSHDQTLRLGELRLVVQEGRVISAVDRKIDLDDAIPSPRALRRITSEAR
jgi:2',3'-cyclic-nucleotide 2'-phosphodiesterase (5'-nucleotidase family)